MINYSGRGEERIPMFTGKPDDTFHVWLKKFQTAAKALKWDSAMQILQIPTFFTGIAENRWQGISEAQVDAFTMKKEPDENDIIRFLKNLFPDYGGADRSASSLYEISQDNKSVGEYLECFEDLIRKACQNETIGSMQKKHLFIRGLDQKLKEKVGFKDPSSFEEALKWASHFESLNNRIKSLNLSEVNVATDRSVHSNGPQCYNCGRFGHIQRFCNDMRGRKGRGARDRRNGVHEPWKKAQPPILREVVPGKCYEIQPEQRNSAPKIQVAYVLRPENDRTPEKPAEKARFVEPGQNIRSLVREDLLLLGEKNGPLSVAKIRVAGVKVIALFDTGATCSVVSESMAERLPKSIKWESPRTEANSASGHKLKFIKSATVMIEVGEKEKIAHRIHVLNYSPYPCLLGTDFLERFEFFRISFNEKCVQLGRNCRLPLIDENEIEKRRQQSVVINLIAANTTVLEPWSQTCVWVNAESAEESQELVVDNLSVSSRLKENGILLARSVGRVRHGLIPVTFLNGSMSPFALYRHATVGNAEVVNENGETKAVHSVCHAPVRGRGEDPLQKLDLSEADLSKEQKHELVQFLKKNSAVFGVGTSNPGQTSKVNHRIDTGNHGPIHARAHRTPFSKKEKVQKLVNEMVESGVARPSSSPWASPIVLIRKKDGDDRFCVDYRELNNITKKDTYPLPKITELLDSLGNAKFFTTKQKSLGESPFYLMYGRDARLPSDVAFQATRPYYGDIDENLKENIKRKFAVARSLAKEALEKAQEKMKFQYDRKVSESAVKEGDLVSLHSPAVPPGVSPKLWVHWKGPYEVIKSQIPNVLLKNKTKDSVAFWVHLNRIKPFFERYKTNRKDDEPEEKGVAQNEKVAKHKRITVIPEHSATFGHQLRSGRTYGSGVHCSLQAPHPQRKTTYWNRTFGSEHRVGTQRRY